MTAPPRLHAASVLLAFTTLASTSASAAPTVATWTAFEAAFTSASHYANPWTDVDVNVTFSLDAQDRDGAPEPASMTTPAFWDGNATWRVRFAPPTVGLWTFSSTCSNPADTGLHGQHGALTAVPYSGTNPLYAHGFLRPSANARYLEHADGTPFYWLGDTHWAGFSSEEWFDHTDNDTWGGGGSMFKALIDTRAAQGYSAWKAETFALQNGTNDGGSAWLGGPDGFFKLLNPAFWRDIDRRVAAVSDAGLAVSLAFAGIGSRLTTLDLEPALTRLARYSTARYSAFPTVWTTCQEYCPYAKDPLYNVTAQADALWGRVAAAQYYADPHRRSTSLHNCAMNPTEPSWRSGPAAGWYGHITLQQGHGSTYGQFNGKGLPGVDYWLAHYNTEPHRPVLEDEANYELLSYGAMTRPPIPGWLARQSAWQSQVGGAFGFTYGGQGIWFACPGETWPGPGNCGTSAANYVPWFRALALPVGGVQLPLMAAFWRALPWWTLVPDASAVIWDQAAPGAGNPQRPFQKADANRTVVVAYMPRLSATDPPKPGTPYGGVVVGLDRAMTYDASAFDPRTGATTVVTPAAGVSGATNITIPPQSDTTLDWVFLVRARK